MCPQAKSSAISDIVDEYVGHRPYRFDARVGIVNDEHPRPAAIRNSIATLPTDEWSERISDGIRNIPEICPRPSHQPHVASVPTPVQQVDILAWREVVVTNATTTLASTTTLGGASVGLRPGSCW